MQSAKVKIMWKCENVEMWKCANVLMCQWKKWWSDGVMRKVLSLQSTFAVNYAKASVVKESYGGYNRHSESDLCFSPGSKFQVPWSMVYGPW